MTDKKPAAVVPGILIDLETLVHESRKLHWASLSKRLKKAAEKNGVRAFSSAGLCGAPACAGAAVGVACGLEAEPAQTAADAAAADLAAAYAKKGPAAAPGAVALVKKAAATVAITWLPEETARTLIETLGLQDAGIQLFCVAPGTGAFPDVETWRKAVRSAGGSPSDFVAIVSSESAGRAALAAGFRCLAAPDEFTSFQDFSGVRGVLESLVDVPAALEALSA